MFFFGGGIEVFGIFKSEDYVYGLDLIYSFHDMTQFETSREFIHTSCPKTSIAPKCFLLLRRRTIGA